MRVLHISNVLNQSGFSKQAEMHLLALDTAGVDVTARHIDMLNSRNEDVHPRVKELLEKECFSPDVIIQNVLPPFMQRSGRAKCVGYAVLETSLCKNSGWVRNLNLMDAVLVPNYYNKLVVMDSGFKSKDKVFIVPEAIDVDRLSQPMDVHPFKKRYPDRFFFLVVAEWTKRKNIDAVVKAFHAEFSPNEPIELIIKTTPVGFNNPSQDINDRLNNIKAGLKLHKDINRYKRENVICGFLNESEMLSLYQSCDCLVNVSRAEAFCIPVATAMAVGTSVVSVNHSGLDYVKNTNAFVVDSHEEGCFGAVDALPDIYTANERWFECSTLSLREQMRSCYEKAGLRTKLKQKAQKDIQQYRLREVGTIYRQKLEGLFK